MSALFSDRRHAGRRPIARVVDLAPSCEPLNMLSYKKNPLKKKQEKAGGWSNSGLGRTLGPGAARSSHGSAETHWSGNSSPVRPSPE